MHAFVQAAADAASSVIVKYGVPVSVSTLSLVTILPTIVYVVTLLSIGINLYFTIRDKWWRERKNK